MLTQEMIVMMKQKKNSGRDIFLEETFFREKIAEATVRERPTAAFRHRRRRRQDDCLENSGLDRR